MQRLILIILLLVFCFSTELLVAQNNTLDAVHQEGGILVKEGNKKVLFYQEAPKSHNGEYTRNNYIHPLYDLNGHMLTEDFPEDHLHQRGIFWAWHQILVDGQEMGDMWSTEDFNWEVEALDTREEGRKLLLEPVVYWKSPLLKDDEGNQIPLAKEKNTIVIYPEDNEMRTIDFIIRIQALKDQLYVGGSDNEKGYGGFSLRIRLPEDITFRAEYGQAEPKTTAIQSTPWMDFTGSFTKKGDQSGILVVCHPSNPHFPPGWIIREEGSMQNTVYPGREPVLVSQSEPLILRYRVIIHKNRLKQNTIEHLVSDYKNTSTK